jgi:hypothetical protein
MNKIVNIARFRKEQKQQKVSDIYCSQLTLANGRKISGAAAREARVKSLGGMEKALHDTFELASALASRRRAS